MSSNKASLGRLHFASQSDVTAGAKVWTPRALTLQKAVVYSTQTDTSDELGWDWGLRAS